MEQVWILIGWVFLLTGCGLEESGMEEKPDRGETENRQETILKVEEGYHADSAQVLFFRKSVSGDTLLMRKVIYDIQQFRSTTFAFQLPAGKYEVYLFGNVPTDRMIFRPPYTAKQIWLDYSRGQEVGAVSYGRTSVDVGADTLKAAGMLLLSSSVELTIQDVPAVVERIRVEISNTSAGLQVGGTYLSAIADPPVSEVLEQVKADTTYGVRFYCFPPPRGKKNTLYVRCYGATGSVIYVGQSQPFEARPGENSVMACRFEERRAAPVRTVAAGREAPGTIWLLKKEK